MRAAPESNENNTFLVQLVEVGIGGELRVKNEFVWDLAGSLFPIADKLENLVILFLFTKLSISVAKDPGVRILRQKSQHTLLPAAALRDVVFLDQSILAMEWNRMEVEIERGPVLQAQGAHRIVPKAHEHGIARRVNTATVLGQKGTFGHHVETGKEGQAVVEDIAHDMARTGIAKEFQGQEGAHR